MAQVNIEKMESILNHILRESNRRWGQDLVSVIVFGSFARGDAYEHSDIDLLIIVKNLPKGWRERGAYELSLERLGLTWNTPLQVILVEPEEIRLAIDNVMALLLEIRESYRYLFDRDMFFQKEMKRFEKMMIRRGVRRLAEHKWEVPEIAR
jgi:predicted nucleotidyltransferase